MRFVLAMDSGGSKTAAVLLGEDGAVRARVVGRGTAAQVRGAEAVREALVPVLAQVLAPLEGALERLQAVYMCLGGLHADEVQEVLVSLVSAPSVRVRKESSGEVVQVCAPLWGFDVAVMAGTGSIVHGMGAAGEHRVAGGWGPLIHDRGSGHDIGRAALQAVAESLDLQGPATSLLGVLSAFPAFAPFLAGVAACCHIPGELTYRERIDIKERIKSAIPSLDRRTVASLFPLVASCAEAGDPVCRDLLAQGGAALARPVCSLSQQLGLVSPAIITLGGVFAAGALVLDPFLAAVRRQLPCARWVNTDFSLLAGAAVVALGDAGIAVTPAVLQRLRQDLATWAAASGVPSGVSGAALQ